MSRQRDYQPTIDRARSQAEIADRRITKIRAQKDECHREMLRAQAAARIAGEEADHLREQVTILESIVRDLKADRSRLHNDRATLIEALDEAQKTAGQRVRGWFRDMLRIGAEA